MLLDHMDRHRGERIKAADMQEVGRGFGQFHHERVVVGRGDADRCGKVGLSRPGSDRLTCGHQRMIRRRVELPLHFHQHRLGVAAAKQRGTIAGLPRAVAAHGANPGSFATHQRPSGERPLGIPLVELYLNRRTDGDQTGAVGLRSPHRPELVGVFGGGRWIEKPLPGGFNAHRIDRHAIGPDGILPQMKHIPPLVVRNLPAFRQGRHNLQRVGIPPHEAVKQRPGDPPFWLAGDQLGIEALRLRAIHEREVCRRLPRQPKRPPHRRQQRGGKQPGNKFAYT